MRLKLFGPDYKDQDPTKALEDFKKRVQAYESAYEPLGKWEEDNDLQYIQVCAGAGSFVTCVQANTRR